MSGPTDCETVAREAASPKGQVASYREPQKKEADVTQPVQMRFERCQSAS